MKSFITVMAIISAIQTAKAAVDMKHCVQYMRGNNSIAPYVPISDDGNIDQKLLDQLIDQKRVTYVKSSGSETITARNGVSDIKITISRNSGKISRITSVETTSIPGMFANRSVYGGMLTLSESSEENHNFSYTGDVCVPKSAGIFTKSANGPSVQAQKFSFNHCRDLNKFFKENPNLKSCSDKKIVDSLKSIMKGMPNSVFSWGFTGSTAQSASRVFNGKDLSEGNLFAAAAIHYENCENTAGVSSAVNDTRIGRLDDTPEVIRVDQPKGEDAPAEN